MNTPKGLDTDHRDRDGLNNQRYNLRVCTNSDNQKNKQAWGTSKYLGVSLHTSRHDYHYKNSDKTIECVSSRWIATIRHEKKVISLGRFQNEIGAARAYDEGAKKYHGEFANLNFK
jgi:hypothetical protein